MELLFLGLVFKDTFTFTLTTTIFKILQHLNPKLTELTLCYVDRKKNYLFISRQQNINKHINIEKTTYRVLTVHVRAFYPFQIRDAVLWVKRVDYNVKPTCWIMDTHNYSSVKRYYRTTPDAWNNMQNWSLNKCGKQQIIGVNVIKN